MKTRDNAKSCVITVLENAVRERFRYPRKKVSEDFVSKTANKLELIAYDYSRIFTDDVVTELINGEFVSTIQKGQQKSKDQVSSYDAYISNAATLVIHISPEFYTGRHSFLFKDRLVQGKLPANLMELDRGELWPEIFANDYLTQQELEMIELQREVERNIAVSGLEKLIKNCCSDNVCSLSDREMHHSKIFKTGSPFTQSLNYVCFGKGATCWQKDSNKIVLPCNGSVCQNIPDGAKTLYNSTNAYKYFSTCMMYEDFLRSIAFDAMKGSVPDPTDPTKEIDDDALMSIRKRYQKEMKMMRYYLDRSFSE